MTAYHDLDSPQTMRADAAAGARLPAVTPTTLPTSQYADLFSAYPTDLPKPEIEVTEAARRLAQAIFD
ncbi:MAG TPA: hypothetical protein PL137_13830 [Nocardioides sp.]|nr:hypothetical protein [Nocardioides sp.]